jgi:hypothetical protein
VLDALRIERPRLRLRHLGDGRLDIDDVLARLRSPEQPSGPLPRFKLANVEIQRGELDLADDSVNRTHELRDLSLSLPLLSSLDSQREVRTEPRLAFSLNGTPFEARASGTPFAPGHHAEVSIKAQRIDIGPYLSYWPSGWPFHPRQGELELELTAAFEQTESPVLKLGGRLAARDFQLDEVLPDGKTLPLAAWQDLSVELKNSQPLARQLHLEAVRWAGPRLQLRRDAQGRLNLQRILAAWRPASLAAPAAASADTGWKLALDQFELAAGGLRWQDAAASPAADLAAEQISLQARNIAWPGEQPASLEGSARLAGGMLSWSGQASERMARIGLSARELSLAAARPYLPATLPPGLTGRVFADATLDWHAASAGAAQRLELQARKLELRSLALGPAAQPLAAWSRLALEQTELDLTRNSLSVGKLLLEQPRLQLSRDGRGRWMFEDWLPPAGPPGAATSTTAKAAASRPWQVALADVQLRQGEVDWADATTARPVRLFVRELELQARDLRPLAEQPAQLPISLSMRLSRRAGQDGGRLAYRGSLRLPAAAPVPATASNSLAAQGALELDRLPLGALEPYFGQALNLRLLHADASLRGTVAAALPPEGAALKLKGDLSIDDLRADTLDPAERLLDWKNLGLRGLQLELSRGRLESLEVGETVLNDYFARIIIDPSGSINLQKLLREPAASPDSAATPPGAGATAQAPAISTAAAGSPLIRIGPSAFVKGRVHFSDRFIKPNYSADLSELTGRLGAFDNRVPAGGEAAPMAELSLSGRAEGTATLEVSGRLNPLAQPLMLDIQGAVRALDLPPLSPYTAKYAGYGIERGKLSMDVRYRIDPGGQLEASNQLVLNQLVFGDRIAGSEAPDLPLKLAVALLADRNGVINVNLPISGSINDPQFRIGAIVVRLIFSLVAKAVTAPFALLTHALGGAAEEFHQIEFAPGSATLDAAALKRLEQVATVMTSRTGLLLTIAGESDLERERSAYQRERVRAMVQEDKRRALERQGSATAAEAPIEVQENEYPALLARAYRRADIPKPRNLIGLPRDLPVPEMEALLQASVPVDEEALRELARNRSVAVRDQLLTLKVPPERLFLGTPQARAAREQAWRPQADLRLSTP